MNGFRVVLTAGVAAAVVVVSYAGSAQATEPFVGRWAATQSA